MIKAVIFDLDGTLLNTLEGLKISTNYTLEKYNYPVHSTENIRKFVGNGVRKLIERALPKGASTPEFEQILKDFKIHYEETMDATTKPYDDILELLSKLKSRGIKIAVLSNKFDAAVKTLCKKHFQDLADITIGESSLTPQKPNPKGTLNILRLLNVKADEVVFVGDSEVDAQTAQNANLIFIGVLWGFRNKETLIQAGSKILINNPLELLEHI